MDTPKDTKEIEKILTSVSKKIDKLDKTVSSIPTLLNQKNILSYTDDASKKSDIVSSNIDKKIDNNIIPNDNIANKKLDYIIDATLQQQIKYEDILNDINDKLNEFILLSVQQQKAHADKINDIISKINESNDALYNEISTTSDLVEAEIVDKKIKTKSKVTGKKQKSAENVEDNTVEDTESLSKPKLLSDKKKQAIKNTIDAKNTIPKIVPRAIPKFVQSPTVLAPLTVPDISGIIKKIQTQSTQQKIKVDTLIVDNLEVLNNTDISGEIKGGLQSNQELTAQNVLSKVPRFLLPTSINTDRNKKDVKQQSSTAGGWVPPTGEETTVKIKKPAYREQDTTKEFLSKIWNKVAAKEAYNEKPFGGGKVPFLGKLVNGIVAGLGQSALMQSPYGKIIKFLLSPGGLMLMYFIYKLFKKYIWDPYIAPIVDWIKQTIVPMVGNAIDFIVKSIWPPVKDLLAWFSKVMPTWEELNAAFKELWTAISSPGSFMAKFGNILLAVGNLIDTALSPLTNLIKQGEVKMLMLFAQIMDGLSLIIPKALGGDKFKAAAASLMGTAQVVVSSMHGSDEYKKEQQTALQQSDIGQAYLAQVDPAAAAELNKKMKTGTYVPTDNEKAILNSTFYKNQYGDVTQSIGDIRKKEFGDQLALTKSMQPGITDEEALQRSRKVYENKGLRESQRIISELRSKKTLTEAESQDYMQKLLDDKNAMSRSAEAQQAVLDEIKKMLSEGNIKSDVVKNRLGIAEKQINETRIINNNMINNSLPKAARVQRNLTANN